MIQLIVPIIVTTIIALAIGYFHKDIQKVRDIFDKRRNEKRQTKKAVRDKIIKLAVEKDAYYYRLRQKMSDDLKTLIIGILGVTLMTVIYLLMKLNTTFPEKPIENLETFRLINKIIFLAGYIPCWGIVGSAFRSYYRGIKLFRDIDSKKFKFKPTEDPSEV